MTGDINEGYSKSSQKFGRGGVIAEISASYKRGGSYGRFDTDIRPNTG
jgi:hypothetical protein